MSNIIKYNKQKQNHKQNNLKKEIYFEIQKIYSLIIILILFFDNKYNYILNNNKQINIEYNKKSKYNKYNKKNKRKGNKEIDEKIRIEEKMEMILNLYFKRLIISYTIMIIIIISFIIYLNYKLK